MIFNTRKKFLKYSMNLSLTSKQISPTASVTMIHNSKKKIDKQSKWHVCMDPRGHNKQYQKYDQLCCHLHKKKVHLFSKMTYRTMKLFRYINLRRQTINVFYYRWEKISHCNVSCFQNLLLLLFEYFYVIFSK